MKMAALLGVMIVLSMLVVIPPSLYAQADSCIISTNDDGKSKDETLSFKNEDLLKYVPSTSILSMYLDADSLFKNDENIDALHILSDGSIIFSTGGDGKSKDGTLSFKNEDLLKYVPSTSILSMYLDADSLFKNDENIDALYIFSDNSIIFSTGGDGKSKDETLSFKNEDLLKYVPSTSILSMYLDADSLFKNDENIDALHILSDGSIIFSTGGDGKSKDGTLSFKNEDLLKYVPSTSILSMYLDADSLFKNDENIDALYINETNKVVPEPATMSLLGLGLAGLLRFRKKKLL